MKGKKTARLTSKGRKEKSWERLARFNLILTNDPDYSTPERMEMLQELVRERAAWAIALPDIPRPLFDQCVEKEPNDALNYHFEELTPEQVKRCANLAPMTATRVCPELLPDDVWKKLLDSDDEDTPGLNFSLLATRLPERLLAHAIDKFPRAALSSEAIHRISPEQIRQCAEKSPVAGLIYASHLLTSKEVAAFLQGCTHPIIQRHLTDDLHLDGVPAPSILARQILAAAAEHTLSEEHITMAASCLSGKI